MTESHKIRLVLADDHLIVRAGIRQFLDMEEDFEVVAEADDGDQAKALIEQHKPDVAILDIQMPKSSGIEVTRHIRSNRWAVGVLILTAFEDDPYVTAVLKAGANGYIMKTARPQEIIQAVRDVHQGKSVLDRAIVSKVMAYLSSPAGPPITINLSDREMEVLTLAAKGQTNRTIAQQLAISDRTVQGHIARIFEKMQANSRTEAVMKAVSMGLIPPDIAHDPEE
ncbi:MAG TPA: response regulator transcription factor [Bellilinea sp.]|nr:response regulator transcription factor [Bellilinea sp.]